MATRVHSLTVPSLYHGSREAGDIKELSERICRLRRFSQSESNLRLFVQGDVTGKRAAGCETICQLIKRQTPRTEEPRGEFMEVKDLDWTRLPREPGMGEFAGSQCDAFGGSSMGCPSCLSSLFLVAAGCCRPPVSRLSRSGRWSRKKYCFNWLSPRYFRKTSRRSGQ